MREGKSQIGQTTQEKCSENFWTQTKTDCELAAACDVVFDKLCLCGRLDRSEMRKWVATEVTHRAHSEASMLLSRADKDKVSHMIKSHWISV